MADFVGSDRGLRRLAVTPIENEDLTHPLTVRPDDDAMVAPAAIGPEGFAVVVDGQMHLHGWVSRRGLEAGGAVRDRTHRFAEVVELRSSLKRGFSAIVQHGAGWLPVVEKERYVPDRDPQPDAPEPVSRP